MHFEVWLLVLLAIAIFAVCIYATCIPTYRIAEDEVPPPRTKRSSEQIYSGRDAEADRALAIQAKRLKEAASSTSLEGITYFEWLTECIKHLRSLWQDCSYDDAKHNIEGFLEMADMKYPDPDYKWTLRSARDLAIEVASDCGEDFGSNE